MKKYSVTASRLNVRNAPRGNVVGLLSKGESVEVSQIATEGNTLWACIGQNKWVSYAYLSPVESQDVPPPFAELSDFAESLFGAALFTRPYRVAIPKDSSTDFFTVFMRTLNALNIAHPKHILQPKGGKTFCNVYAYQFVQAFYQILPTHQRGYLPRVWWNKEALQKIKAGESLITSLNGRYATAYELNANQLTDWLREFGSLYGWTIEAYQDPQKAQDLANSGYLTLISAKHVNTAKSGHITVVCPEIGNFRRVGHKVVQSQAGATNFILQASDWQDRLRRNYSDVIIAYR